MEVRVTRLERAGGVVAIRAEGWLFVDSDGIYHFNDFGLRVVSRGE
jgi:hypothetical protein